MAKKCKNITGFSLSDDNHASINSITTDPIRNLDDLIRQLKIDLTVWEVIDFKCSPWTVPVIIGSKDNKELVQTQQYSVSARLRRLISFDREKALDRLIEKLEKHAPKYPKPPKVIKSWQEPCMAMFALFDLHLAKLSEDYNLKSAEQIYKNAVNDLISDSNHKNIESILLPVGNDFIHVDNSNYTTTKGTPLATDGHWHKIIDVAEATILWAVEALSAVAPVTVECVPGNHDKDASQWICRIIKAVNKHNQRVKVNISSFPRVYHRYGTTLLGLVHGDLVKPENKPSLMATERPQDWAETRCHEWICGHQHRSRKYTTKDTDTYEGTVIRYLRSLSGTDAWHNENGFIGNSLSRSAEVYWYGKKSGYLGHAIVPVREK